MTNITKIKLIETRSRKQKCGIALSLIFAGLIGSAFNNVSASDTIMSQHESTGETNHKIKLSSILNIEDHLESENHRIRYLEIHNMYMKTLKKYGEEAALRDVMNKFVLHHVNSKISNRYFHRMFLKGLKQMMQNPIGLELVKILCARLDGKSIKIVNAAEDYFYNEQNNCEIGFVFKDYDPVSLLDVTNEKDISYNYKQNGILEPSQNELPYAIFHEMCHFLHYMEKPGRFKEPKDGSLKLANKLYFTDRNQKLKSICNIISMYDDYEEFVTITGLKLNKQGKVKFDVISEAGFRYISENSIRVRHIFVENQFDIPAIEPLEATLYEVYGMLPEAGILKQMIM